MRAITVVGIDAGFAATGLAAVTLTAGERGVVVANNCVRTEKNRERRGLRVADDDAARCRTLAMEVQRFLEAFPPHVVAVELPTGGARGARPNRAMGMATGMIAAVLALGQYAVQWVTPMEVKKAATGHRNASKADVEEAMRRRYDWDAPTPKAAAVREHVFDAAAAVAAVEGGALVRAVRAAQRGVV